MKAFRQALIVLLLTIAFIEVALKVTDPIGITRYYEDSAILFSRIIPNEYGYDFSAGVMDMHVYDATITMNGERYTPSAIGTGCRVATIGDSVTFGMGVNDADTFTELFAQTYTGHWVNRGKPAYNSGNILADAQSVDVDMLIYLATNNDPDSDWVYSRYHAPIYSSALRFYTWHYSMRQTIPMGVNYTPEFEYNVAMLAEYDNLLIFVMTDNPQFAIYKAYGAIAIPPYTEYVSLADTHPSASGHRELFDYMRPYVDRALYEYCGV